MIESWMAYFPTTSHLNNNKEWTINSISLSISFFLSFFSWIVFVCYGFRLTFKCSKMDNDKSNWHQGRFEKYDYDMLISKKLSQKKWDNNKTCKRDKRMEYNKQTKKNWSNALNLSREYDRQFSQLNWGWFN